MSNQLNLHERPVQLNLHERLRALDLRVLHSPCGEESMAAPSAYGAVDLIEIIYPSDKVN